jgi:toxin ParE1/3/4
MNIHLSTRAKEDLIEIWIYGQSRWGSSIADKYLDQLETFLLSLSDNPTGFRLRDEFIPPVRFGLIKSHVAIFTVTDERIFIIRVLHQSADIQTYMS